MDYLDNLYKQYLQILDERDKALALAEKSFFKGLFLGIGLMCFIAASLSLIF